VTDPAAGNRATSGEDKAARSAEEAASVLLRLAEQHPALADSLARLVTVVASEALRTARFGNALQSALRSAGDPHGEGGQDQPKRTGRRQPGVLDPFAIYSADGEGGLRAKLADLDLEQLRDIVAEHGMDHDKLAMKWKTPSRVIDRIVEKVASRSSKGSAFRSGD
jgi:hypothetical protein